MGVSDDAVTLVTAPNAAGENFIKLLMIHHKQVAVLVNQSAQKRRLEKRGVRNILEVNTMGDTVTLAPPFSIGNVYLFEDSLPLCCKYLQICRNWASGSIFVVTGSHRPRQIYKSLGASYIIYTNSEHVSFLLQE